MGEVLAISVGSPHADGLFRDDCPNCFSVQCGGTKPVAALVRTRSEITQPPADEQGGVGKLRPGLLDRVSACDTACPC